MKSNELCLFQVFVLAFEAYPKYKSIAAFTFKFHLMIIEAPLSLISITHFYNVLHAINHILQFHNI